jgi:hypothetical protein
MKRTAKTLITVLSLEKQATDTENKLEKQEKDVDQSAPKPHDAATLLRAKSNP